MVVRLSRGAASVSELAAPLDMSLPSVMQHLDVLQRNGLVRSEKVGRVRRCRLEPGPMRTLEQWIAEHRAIWQRHFDRLSDVLDDAYAVGAITTGSWWYIVPPGVCVVLVVLSFTLVGQALEDMHAGKLNRGVLAL